MPDTVEVLVTEFRADIKRYEAALRRQARATETSARKVERRFQQMNRRIVQSTNRASRQVVAALGGISVAAAFSGSTRVLADFSQAMSSVAAITEATGAEFDALEARARMLGATTRFSATQAAEGMLFLARAGFDTDQVLGSIEGTLQLAQAGALDLGRAADIASNVLSGFRLEIEDSGRVADVLALAANSANTDVTQLGEALKFVAPVAAGLGVPLEEATAAIGKLSDNGLQASLAGTGLRRILSELESPASKSAGIINELGLSLESVRPSSVGLTTALQRLSEQGIDTGQALELFGDRGGPAFEVLSNNIPEVVRMTGALGEAAGTAERIAGVMDDNLNGALLATNSRLQELVLSLGEAGAEDALIGILEGLQSLLTFAAENADTFTKGLIVASAAAAGFISAKALGGAVVLLPRLAAQLAAANAIAATSTLSLNTLTVATRAFFVALGPVGLITIAAGALAAFALNAGKATTVSTEYAGEIDKVTSAVEAYRDAAILANEATGKAKVAAEEDTRIKREQAAATLESARAKITEAKATIAQLAAESRQANRRDVRQKGISLTTTLGNGNRITQLRADIEALNTSIAEAEAILANPLPSSDAAESAEDAPSTAGKTTTAAGRGADDDARQQQIKSQLDALEELGRTEAEQINMLKEMRLAAIAASGRSAEDQARLVKIAEQEAFDAFAELNESRSRIFDERAQKYDQEAEAARQAGQEELAIMAEIEAASARLHGRTIEATRLEFEAQRIRLQAEIDGIDKLAAARARADLANLDADENDFNRQALGGIDSLTGGDEGSLEDTLARIDEEEQAKLDLLASYRDAELEGLRDFEAIKTEIEAEADAERLEARRASLETQLSVVQGTVSNVSSIIKKAAGEGSRAAKAAARVEQGIAIARAAVSTASAVAKSFAAGGGFPFGLPAAAAAAAFGGAQIAAIASQSFATGGLVRGPGTGTSDSVPANLSNGEFVTRERVTQANLDGLRRLNAGASPAEAFGLPTVPVPSAPSAALISAAGGGGNVSIGGMSLTVNGNVTADTLPILEARLVDMERNLSKNVNRIVADRDRRTTPRSERRVGRN